MIHAFSVEINRPLGKAQRLFYRSDREFHFLIFMLLSTITVISSLLQVAIWDIQLMRGILHDCQTWGSDNSFTYRSTFISQWMEDIRQFILCLHYFISEKVRITETLAKTGKQRNCLSKSTYRTSNRRPSSIPKRPWPIWDISKSTVFFTCNQPHL